MVEVAVWCKHYMSEILVERKPYFMAVRPRSACFQVMRDALGGGAYRGVRRAVIEGQW